MKYYGAGLSRDALVGYPSDSDERARMFASMDMDACWLHYGIPFAFGSDVTAGRTMLQEHFKYCLDALRRVGVKFFVPLSIPDDTDEQMQIDWTHELLSLVGGDIGAVVIDNERNRLLQLSDDKSIEEIEEIERKHFEVMTSVVRQYTDALLIGSQSGYQFQTNTMQACDVHWYPKNLLLDDADLWPLTTIFGNHPAVPWGVTEFDSNEADWNANTIVMAYCAAVNGADWLIKHHMGQHWHLQEKDHGGHSDEHNYERREILKLAGRVFREVEQVQTIGYKDDDYIEKVKRTNNLHALNHNKPFVPYWDVLPGMKKGDPLVIDLGDVIIACEGNKVSVSKSYG